MKISTFSTKKHVQKSDRFDLSISPTFIRGCNFIRCFRCFGKGRCLMSQLQGSTNSYSTVERSLPSLACKMNTAKLSKTRHSDGSCGEQPDSGSLKSLRTVWEQFEPTEVLQRRCRRLPFQWLISGFKSSPPTAVPSECHQCPRLSAYWFGSLDPWIPPFLRLWSLRSFPNESAALSRQHYDKLQVSFRREIEVGLHYESFWCIGCSGSYDSHKGRSNRSYLAREYNYKVPPCAFTLGQGTCPPRHGWSPWPFEQKCFGSCRITENHRESQKPKIGIPWNILEVPIEAIWSPE